MLKSLFRKSSTLFLGNSAGIVINIISVMLITKNVAVRDFGYVVTIETIIYLYDALFNFQSWQAVIKYFSLKDKSRIVLSGFVLDIIGSIMAFLFLYFTVDLVIGIFSLDIKSIDVKIYSIILLTRMVGTPTAILRIFNKYLYFSLQSIISYLLKLITVIYFILDSNLSTGKLLLIYAIQHVSSDILIIFFSFYALNQNGIKLNFSQLANTFSFLRKEKRILKFVINTNFNGTINKISKHIDQVIISSLISFEASGIYRIIKMSSQALGAISDPIYQVIYPDIVELINRKKSTELFSSLKKYTQISFLFSIIVFIGLLFFGKFFITLFFSESYLAGINALYIYVAGLLLGLVFSYAQPLMLAFELEHIALRINIINASSYLFMLYFLTKSYGLMGAASSFLIYILISTFARLWIVYIKKNKFF